MIGSLEHEEFMETRAGSRSQDEKVDMGHVGLPSLHVIVEHILEMEEPQQTWSPKRQGTLSRHSPT